MTSDPTRAYPAETNSTSFKARSHSNRHNWIRYGIAANIGILMLLGIATGARLLRNTPSAASVTQSRVLPVETLEAEPVSSYQVARIYTGEIAALRSSSLGFERSGELVQVMVSEGQQVYAGEPLAQLDIRNLETQRLQIEAQRAQAQARLTELENGARPEDIAVAEAAVRDLEHQLTLQKTQQQRREYLYEQGAIAREQLDEFTFGENSLQARLDQARSSLDALLNGTRIEQVNAQKAVVNQFDAQLQDLAVTLAKSILTAPFDGIVARRQVDEGTVVGGGQAVLQLVENAAPEARIGMPVEVAAQLQMGAQQTVRVNNQSYSAQVDAVLPQVDTTTRTQAVVLALEPTALGQIEPGQTARLTIEETIQANGYWVPIDALTQGIRGLWTCYVLVPKTTAGQPRSLESFTSAPDTPSATTAPNDHTADSNAFIVERRAVEIIQQESTEGATAAGTRALVRGTLQPGEKIVASGVHRLVAGQQVRPVNAN